MPRHGLSKLTRPGKRYRPDRAGRRFESKEEKQLEDAKRRQHLIRPGTTASLTLHEQKLAKRLAKKFIQADQRKKLPPTIASARYMRKQRVRIVGRLWELFEKEVKEGGRVSTFHVLPPSWAIPSEELHGLDPHRLLEQFRRDLTRLGKAPMRGWLFASIHGEFDPENEVFHLHLHGLASNTMLRRVNELRYLRKYRLGSKLNKGRKNRPSIRITRKELRDPLRALSYCLQSWWNVKSFTSDADGTTRRTRSKMRIPAHHQARYLIWLDQHRIEDVTILMGLAVKKGRLSRTGKWYRNAKHPKRKNG